MADDEIIQNIRLTGVAEVVAGFAAIAEAGKTAFAALERGVTSTGFGDMAASLTGLVSALGLATAGVVAWDQSLANAVFTMSNLAQEMGTTTAELGNMEMAMASMGATIDNIGVAFRRFATRMEAEWPRAQKAMQEAANQAQEDAAAVVQANERVAESFLKIERAVLEHQKAQIAEAHGPEAARETAEQDAEAEIRAAQEVEDVRINISRARQDRARKEAQLELELNRNRLEQQKLELEQDRMAQDFAMRRAEQATNAAQAQLSYEQQLYEYQVKYENRPRDPQLEKEMQQRQDLLKLQEAYNKMNEAETAQKREAADEQMKRDEAEQRRQELQMQRQQLQLELERMRQDEARKRAEEDERLREQLERQREAQERRRRDAEEAKVRQQELALRTRETGAAETQARLAQQKAQADAAKEEQKQREDQANDVRKFKQYFDDLAKGIHDNTSDMNMSVENLTKGFAAHLGEAGDKVKDFRGGLTGMASAMPAQREQFLQFADALKEMSKVSPQTMEAFATSVLGRGYSQSLVKILSQGREAIEAEEQRLKSVGLDITDDMAARNEKLFESFAKLGSEVQALGMKLVDAFTPATASVIEAIRIALEGNVEAAKAFANSIAQSVTPAILGFVEAVSGMKVSTPGFDQKEIDSWRDSFNNIKQEAAQWVESMKGYWEDAKAGFRELMNILDMVAEAINKLAGTHLTGAELGIGLIVSQFIGLNGAILAVIQTVGILATALAAIGGGWAVAIVAGAVAAGAAIYEIATHWDQVKTAASGAVDAINKALESYNNAGNQKLEGMWDSFKSAGAGAWQSIESAAEGAIDYIKAGFSGIGSSIQGLGANAWDQFKEGATAAFDSAKSGAAVLVQGIEQALGGLASAWHVVEQAGASTWNAIQSAGQSTIDALRSGISSIGSAIGSLGTYWQQFESAAAAAFDDAKNDARGLVQYVASALNGLRSVWGPIAQAGATAWNEIESAAQGAIDSIKSAISQIGPSIEGLASHWGAVISAIQSVQGAIGGLASYIVQALGSAWNQVAQAGQAAWNAILGAAMGVISAIEGAFTSMISAISSALSKLGSMMSGAGGGGQGSSVAPGFASGGMVHGSAGTDTNLIAATAGEFVMSKPAVDSWGSSFMNSINTMSRSSIPRYATGGPVGATGSVGAVGGTGSRANVPYGTSRALTLNILGTTFTGLWGPEHVMNSLETYASYLEGVSAGAPPSWMR